MSTGVSGVRNSWESMARNWSFARLASSASCFSFLRASSASLRAVKALLTFAQPFLLLHHFADIGAINGEPIAAGIDARINPAPPRFVKDLKVIGLLRLHGAMTALIEFGADGFGKNFPDYMADQLFFPLSRQFEDAFVHVGIAPVAIDDGESVADTGEGGFALVEQITNGALMPTRSRCRLQC